MNSGKKTILFVAGEASGDLHGSKVIKALRRLNPKIQICAMGGERMRESGAEIIVDSSQLAVVGITEVVGRIRGLWKAFQKLKKFIKKNKPSLLILIDFPDFNLALARTAKQAGIPILYYIGPQVWAWRSGRVKKISRLVNRMAVIFPFETPIYQKAGLDVEFVGHPLLDMDFLPLGPTTDTDSDMNGLKGEPLIALLPGSREKEVHFLLPEMIRAARIILEHKPTAKFVLPAAPTVDIQAMREYLQTQSVPVSLVQGETYIFIKAVDLVIVASGTATLEAAILGKPMVVIYRVSPLSYWVGELLVKTDWISLVNIVAGEKAVPELLQNEARGERIAAEAMRILNDISYRQGMLQTLARVREKLGSPGAAERVAKIALKEMGDC